MANQTILIIRHAEKPEPGGDIGINSQGQPDKESLTPRGWQRAGTWVQLFAPPSGQNALLPQPNALFAADHVSSNHETAADGDGSKSRRPLETIRPLADKLGVQIDHRFTKGGERNLASAISGIDGVVLVCWQHEDIARIASAPRRFRKMSPKVGQKRGLTWFSGSIVPDTTPRGRFDRSRRSCLMAMSRVRSKDRISRTRLMTHSGMEAISPSLSPNASRLQAGLVRHSSLPAAIPAAASRTTLLRQWSCAPSVRHTAHSQTLPD